MEFAYLKSRGKRVTRQIEIINLILYFSKATTKFIVLINKIDKKIKKIIDKNTKNHINRKK